MSVRWDFGEDSLSPTSLVTRGSRHYTCLRSLPACWPFDLPPPGLFALTPAPAAHKRPPRLIPSRGMAPPQFRDSTMANTAAGACAGKTISAVTAYLFGGYALLNLADLYLTRRLVWHDSQFGWEGNPL